MTDKEKTTQKSIKTLRKFYGIKQHELASEMHISRSLISHWERLSARCKVVEEVFEAIKRIAERKEKWNVTTKDS